MNLQAYKNNSSYKGDKVHTKVRKKNIFTKISYKIGKER